MDIFSKRLKSYRESLKRKDSKWTQEYIAEKVGVARVTYTAYESGSKTPPIDTVSRIADILNVKADYLLGRTDDPNPDERKGNFFHFNKDEIGDEDAILLEDTFEIMKERQRRRAEEKRKKNNL